MKRKNIFNSKWLVPLLMVISGAAFIGSMGATFYQVSLIAQTPASSSTVNQSTQIVTQQTNTPPQAANQQTTQAKNGVANEPDTARQQDNARGKKNHLNDLQRELRDIEREAKSSPEFNELLTKSLTVIIPPYENCINELEKMIGNSGFWDKNRDCDEKSRIVNDHYENSVRPQRECLNFRNTIKDRRRELRDNIERQIKDIKRNDTNTNITALETKKIEIEGLITKLEQLILNCNRNTNNAGNDIRQDLNYKFRDFYDAANEIGKEAEQTRRAGEQKRNYENMKQNCEKDKKRQLRELERDSQRSKNGKNFQESYEKVKIIYDKQCGELLNKLNETLSKKDADSFNSIERDFNDIERDFWDLLNENRGLMQQKQEVENIKRMFDEKLRSCKDQEREYKRAQRENRVTKELESAFAVISCDGKFLNELKSAAASDNSQKFHDIQRDYDDAVRDFWDTMQKSNFVSDISRNIKDMQRECKDRDREVRHLIRESSSDKTAIDNAAIERIKKIASDCENFITRAKETVASGDNKKIEILMEDTRKMREEWGDVMSELSSKREIFFAKNELIQIDKETDQRIKEIEDLRGRKKIKEDEAIICIGFGKKMQDLVAQARKQESSSANSNKNESSQLRDLIEQIRDIGHQAEIRCDKFIPRGPVNIEQIVEENFRNFESQIYQEVLKRIFARINQDFINQVTTKLTTNISSTILENLLQKVQDFNNEGLQNRLAGILENTVYLGDKANRVLETQNDIFDLVKELQSIASRSGNQEKALNNLIGEIQGATPVGELAEELKSRIKQFLNTAESASEKDLNNLIKEFINSAREILGRNNEAAYKEGFIPCKDTGIDQWFTKYAAELIDKRIIEGKRNERGEKTGECAPNERVKIIEALKMIYNLAGGGQSAFQGEPKKVKCAEWANGYCAHAESKETFLIARTNNFNRNITRSEVVRLIIETLNVDIVVPEKPSFGDVPASHADYKFVETAKVLRLITGDQNKSTFRPNDELNRAEMFKIVKNAMLLSRMNKERENF